MKIAVILILIALVIVIGPLLSIWALNALFPVLGIPYTFETWLAVILVKGFLTVRVNKPD